MITRQRKKSFTLRLLLPVVAIAFVGYFAYHTFTGSFGIWAMDRLNADGARLAAERDRLEEQKVELQAAVDSVRPESLDADVVDFEARRALNVMRPDEVLIPLGAAQQAAQ